MEPTRKCPQALFTAQLFDYCQAIVCHYCRKCMVIVISFTKLLHVLMQIFQFFYQQISVKLPEITKLASYPFNVCFDN